MAHRLELAYKDSCKEMSLYQKAISTLAMGLYYFYQSSPLNRTNLRRAAAVFSRETSQEDVQESSSKQVVFPTRVSGTRWVGHINRALTNITSGYSYIVLHLQQVCVCIGLLFIYSGIHLSSVFLMECKERRCDLIVKQKQTIIIPNQNGKACRVFIFVVLF
jgi:hypothetical protein